VFTQTRLRCALALACLSAFTLAVPSAAQDAPPALDDETLCASADDETVVALCEDNDPALGIPSFTHSAEGEDGLPVVCQYPVEAIFWTGEGWQLLGQALAANLNPCATYHVSIPPLVNNRTQPRQPAVFTAFRNLGPQFFPMAEMTMHLATGWVNWIKTNNKTWYEAGVEFRRRMTVAGASTWFVNEMDGETRLDTGDKTRVNMLELLRGLYEGPPGSVPLQGAIEIGIAGRHQDLSDVSPTYKEELKDWLADGAFWAEADQYVRWLAVEAYPDTRHHGVPGSSREERSRHVGDYIFHVLDLAEAGPESVEPAREFFARAYLPLASAGWSYSRGFGNTLVSGEQMAHFVSEELYAIRHQAGSSPHGAPAGRLGLSWDPQRLNPDGTPIMDQATFAAGNTLLRARIAEAIRFAYRQGGASPVGACHVPSTEASWCDMQREGAEFVDYWSGFGSWE